MSTSPTALKSVPRRRARREYTDDHDDSGVAVVDVAAAALGEHMSRREVRIKREIAAVAVLWLVGCPVLCLLLRRRPIFGGDGGGDGEASYSSSDSLYGLPDEDAICGLYSYSISSSMTGTYPKILGSLLAPLFALLVVQRTSNGLCSHLKLGLLVRFSLLLSPDNKKTAKNNVGDASTRGKREQLQQQQQDDAADAAPATTATGPFSSLPHHQQLVVAKKAWLRIERIEYLGYCAAMLLVALVAFDSRDFTVLHCILSSMAFFALFRQNWLVGTLGDDEYGAELFPDWSCPRAFFVFYLGMFHLAVFYVGFFAFGYLRTNDKCKDLLSALESISMTTFGNPTTARWLASVAFWYNEYAFAALCVYVQLLRHYELRLWDFTGGATNMPYMAIVSRFSIRSAVESIVFGVASSSSSGSSDADVFLGFQHIKKAPE